MDGVLETASVAGECKMTGTVDAEYYEVVPSGGHAERLFVAARNQLFRDFLAHMSPTHEDRIVDIGVSDVVNEAANVLERMYPHPERITACGIGSGAAFQKAYPKVKFVQIYPDESLPFENNSFEIATANAVLEHLGSMDAQRLFVNELCRVARRVYITVPNRLFPVEHHTALPFVHYFDGSFRIVCRFAGKERWSEERNLILMSRKRLWRICEGINRSITVGYTGLKLGPFSSNLLLSIR
jgi:Methyltransferase domain